MLGKHFPTELHPGSSFVLRLLRWNLPKLPKQASYSRELETEACPAKRSALSALRPHPVTQWVSFLTYNFSRWKLTLSALSNTKHQVSSSFQINTVAGRSLPLGSFLNNSQGGCSLMWHGHLETKSRL